MSAPDERVSELADAVTALSRAAEIRRTPRSQQALDLARAELAEARQEQAARSYAVSCPSCGGAARQALCVGYDHAVALRELAKLECSCGYTGSPSVEEVSS